MYSGDELHGDDVTSPEDARPFGDAVRFEEEQVARDRDAGEGREDLTDDDQGSFREDLSARQDRDRDDRRAEAELRPDAGTIPEIFGPHDARPCPVCGDLVANDQAHLDHIAATHPDHCPNCAMKVAGQPADCPECGGWIRDADQVGPFAEGLAAFVTAPLSSTHEGPLSAMAETNARSITDALLAEWLEHENGAVREIAQREVVRRRLAATQGPEPVVVPVRTGVPGALDRFGDLESEAIALADRIRAKLLAGIFEGEIIHYGHVGDMSSIVGQLRGVSDQLFLEGEYAPDQQA